MQYNLDMLGKLEKNFATKKAVLSTLKAEMGTITHRVAVLNSKVRAPALLSLCCAIGAVAAAATLPLPFGLAAASAASMAFKMSVRSAYASPYQRRHETSITPTQTHLASALSYLSGITRRQTSLASALAYVSGSRSSFLAAPISFPLSQIAAAGLLTALIDCVSLVVAWHRAVDRRACP